MLGKREATKSRLRRKKQNISVSHSISGVQDLMGFVIGPHHTSFLGTDDFSFIITFQLNAYSQN